MFANSQMGGLDTAFPDVCITPAAPSPVPVPYPNLAPGPMTVPSQTRTLFMCTPAHNLMSVCPMSQGDNPGVGTGVASATVMGPRRHLTAAFTVLVGGVPATRLTSATIQNNTNAPGVRVVPSQVKVVLLAP